MVRLENALLSQRLSRELSAHCAGQTYQAGSEKEQAAGFGGGFRVGKVRTVITE
jgi:hypothetical protein